MTDAVERDHRAMRAIAREAKQGTCRMAGCPHEASLFLEYSAIGVSIAVCSEHALMAEALHTAIDAAHRAIGIEMEDRWQRSMTEAEWHARVDDRCIL